MKKGLAILLAAVMALALTACGPKEVELTTENIEDYLALSFDYTKVERKKSIGISFGYTDLSLRTYGVASGSFSDVELTVEIPLSNGWSVSSSDTAYQEEDSETLRCTFRLPASGEYSETHHLIASMVFRDPDNQNIPYTITGVSGTFTPSK